MPSDLKEGWNNFEFWIGSTWPSPSIQNQLLFRLLTIFLYLCSVLGSSLIYSALRPWRFFSTPRTSSCLTSRLPTLIEGPGTSDFNISISSVVFLPQPLPLPPQPWPLKAWLPSLPSMPRTTGQALPQIIPAWPPTSWAETQVCDASAAIVAPVFLSILSVLSILSLQRSNSRASRGGKLEQMVPVG